MFRSIVKFTKGIYGRVIQSIAFYPVIITLGFLLFAFAMLELENLDLAKTLKENLPYLFISDYDTARDILTTLVGGVLSLTVFSFSMVMVVLSQASSNFSPRLLPSLISNKNHQFILGVYIGTLLYCIILLVVLGARGIDSASLGFSTMLAAMWGVVCVALFVYFIHNISTSIQIQNIIESIYNLSNRQIDREIERAKDSQVELQMVKTDDFTTISAPKTGYFRGFDVSLLPNSFIERGNQIEVIPYLGAHIWEGTPMLRLKNKVEEDDLNSVLFCCQLSRNRNDHNDGVGGMVKLMEIAVKAMSPGINDPGTAIDAITKLIPLLQRVMRLPKITSVSLHEGKIILMKNNITASQLMQTLIQPIRLYAKKDNTVVATLIGALSFLERDTQISRENREGIRQEIQALKKDVEDNINNDLDRERILKLFQNHNNT
ncbi:DUF2254 domain-containing protein [Arenibacter latericius]|uniref:DUF2254 domain-containing protein n=1 Tax=Arenibacter latericius TaxID=86104 RepID=UPI00041BF0A2|nr:DUF2254 domain-containing protein [Arenibacter latericius]MDX1363443.1 DUF2254 domain-containing protein [Arenibacter latericius]